MYFEFAPLSQHYKHNFYGFSKSLLTIILCILLEVGTTLVMTNVRVKVDDGAVIEPYFWVKNKASSRLDKQFNADPNRVY